MVTARVLYDGERAHRLLVRARVYRRNVRHLELALPSDVARALHLEPAHLNINLVASLSLGVEIGAITEPLSLGIEGSRLEVEDAPLGVFFHLGVDSDIHVEIAVRDPLVFPGFGHVLFWRQLKGSPFIKRLVQLARRIIKYMVAQLRRRRVIRRHRLRHGLDRWRRLHVLLGLVLCGRLLGILEGFSATGAPEVLRIRDRLRSSPLVESRAQH